MDKHYSFTRYLSPLSIAISTILLAGCGPKSQSYDIVDKPKNIVDVSDINFDQNYIYSRLIQSTPEDTAVEPYEMQSSGLVKIRKAEHGLSLVRVNLTRQGTKDGTDHTVKENNVGNEVFFIPGRYVSY